MDISVVIVNYRVKFFLEQTLASVIQALEGFNAEIFVVDNNSQDDSIEHSQQRFKKVKFIKNKENIGFSKAHLPSQALDAQPCAFR